MRLYRPATIAEFVADAEPYLIRHEAEHGLLLGVAATSPNPRPEAYWALAVERNSVVAAALRTSSRLVVSREGMSGAMALLARDALGPATKAVLGPVPSVAAFIRASNRTWRHGMAQRIYALREVTPPRPALGAHRLARPSDRDVLAGWVESFHAEASGEGFSRDAIERANDRLIAADAMHVWEHDGRLVACTAAVGPTPHGIRINTVYTPPELRKRGYGSALVAAVSQYLLDSGREFVFLHADLSNATTNRMYQRVGYRPVGDAEDISLA